MWQFGHDVFISVKNSMSLFSFERVDILSNF